MKASFILEFRKKRQGRGVRSAKGQGFEPGRKGMARW